MESSPSPDAIGGEFSDCCCGRPPRGHVPRPTGQLHCHLHPPPGALPSGLLKATPARRLEGS
eukprot:1183403-Prorocentrum_minimum.AAC.3